MALVAALVPAIPTSALAQAPPSAQALMARHDSLSGGRAVLDRRQSMRLVGRFTIAAAGIDAPLEILKAKPDRYLFRVDLGAGGELLQGYDGRIAWAVQPGPVAMLLTGEQAEQVASQGDFYADLHDLSRFASLETVGDTVFEGRRVWQVRLMRANGAEVREFFDVVTGLSAGAVTTAPGPGGPLRAVSVYSDYREFDGFRVATRIVQRTPAMEFVLRITALEFDTVDAAALEPPASVKALIK